MSLNKSETELEYLYKSQNQSEFLFHSLSSHTRCLQDTKALSVSDGVGISLLFTFSVGEHSVPRNKNLASMLIWEMDHMNDS